MSSDEIRQLLGGYATGTLTDEERRLLFEAALKDQELFESLADEEALRDVLSDPICRDELMEALEEAEEVEAIPLMSQPLFHRRAEVMTASQQPIPAPAAPAQGGDAPPQTRKGSRFLIPLSIAASLAIAVSTGILFQREQDKSSIKSPDVPASVEIARNSAPEPQASGKGPSAPPAPEQPVIEKKESRSATGPARRISGSSTVESAPSQNLASEDAAKASQRLKADAMAVQPAAPAREESEKSASVTSSTGWVFTAESPDRSAVVKYSVMKKGATGTYSPVPLTSSFTGAEPAQLNLEANENGLLQVVQFSEGGTRKQLVQTRVVKGVPFTVPVEPGGAETSKRSLKIIFTPGYRVPGSTLLPSSSGVVGGVPTGGVVGGTLGLSREQKSAKPAPPPASPSGSSVVIDLQLKPE
jgi:hypothetical protein